jgi:hypothetical protein
MDQLKDIPDLGLRFLSKPALTDFGGYSGVGTSRLSVPIPLAEFFIEAFALDQPQGTALLKDKRFEVPTVLKFRFPAVFPVAVETVPEYINFGFFDTPIATAAETGQLLHGVLNSLSRVPVYIVEFRQVDQLIVNQAAVAQLARDFNVIVLMRFGETDADFETLSVTVFILLSHWNDARDKALKGALKQLFDQAFVGFCKTCGNVFSPVDGGKCHTTKHRGKKVPVVGDQYEVIEYDSSNEPVTFEKYQCCGKVVKGSEGCVTRQRHTLDTTKPLCSYETKLADVLTAV